MNTWYVEFKDGASTRVQAAYMEMDEGVWRFYEPRGGEPLPDRLVLAAPASAIQYAKLILNDGDNRHPRECSPTVTVPSVGGGALTPSLRA